MRPCVKRCLKEEKAMSDEKKAEEKKEKQSPPNPEAERWKSLYIQSLADMSNLRKDMERDAAEERKYGCQPLLSAVIPSLDAMELALRDTPKDEGAKAYAKGFAMIERNLLSALRSSGVSTVDPSVGQRFDATLMRSVSSDPSVDDGTVASVGLRGYVLNGRLVRPATVVVGSRKKTEEKT